MTTDAVMIPPFSRPFSFSQVLVPSVTKEHVPYKPLNLHYLYKKREEKREERREKREERREKREEEKREERRGEERSLYLTVRRTL